MFAVNISLRIALKLTLKQKKKKRLKCDAVASVFSFGPAEAKARLSSEIRENRQHAIELRQEVG